MKNLLSKVFSKQMSIDLGTSNTVIYLKKKGIVLNEATVIAYDSDGEVMAVGNAAKEMIGRTPKLVRAYRPLQEGVIADFETTKTMLQYFLKKAIPSFSYSGLSVIASVPSQVTEVQKRAVKEVFLSIGAKNVHLIEEAMAAAIGAKLPVTEPIGSMVVDIGGGTTEIAVISLGAIVSAQSIPIAGNEFDNAIFSYIKKKHNVVIGDSTAERIKLNIGSAMLPKDPVKMEVTGLDTTTGLPGTIVIDSRDVYMALEETIGQMIAGIKMALEETPPELSADVYVSGIVLCGGGARLPNLDKVISKEIGIPVRIAEDPLYCVVRGTYEMLEHYDTLGPVIYGVR